MIDTTNSSLKKELYKNVGICPLCGSEDISYSRHYLDDCYLIFPATCGDCGCTFQEEYTVEFNRKTDIRSRDGSEFYESTETF